MITLSLQRAGSRREKPLASIFTGTAWRRRHLSSVRHGVAQCAQDVDSQRDRPAPGRADGLRLRRRLRPGRRRYGAPTYFVPSDTLTSEAAARAGIRHEHDLFGGVVPHPFVATKTITHPLVDARVARRRRLVAGVSAPRRRRRAARLSARLRREDAPAGRPQAAETRCGPRQAGRRNRRLGQSVVGPHGGARRVRWTRSIPTSWRRSGVVVEQNLDDVTTYSVGQVRVADLVWHVLRHAAPDDEQPRRAGLRRLRDHRRARRLRRAAGLAVARRDPARGRTGARLRRRGEPVLRGFCVAAQLRRGAGSRRRGPSPLGRARAIVAARRGERRGDRRVGGLSGRSVAAGRARDDARGLWRRARAAVRAPSCISRGVDAARRSARPSMR